MKIGNIGRLDPELKKQGVVGLKHGSKLEEEVWEEFNGDWESLAFESEALIAKLSDKSIEEVVEIEDIKEGVDKEVLVKQRVNQNFFRSTILSSYYFKCCITGLSIPEFLVSSHIVPWSKNKENRLNPRNGLCLNSLHDKAFDRGFLTITPDYVVKLSSSFGDYLESYSVQEYFVKYQDQKIMLPDKFLPKKDFLDYHNQNIFKG